MLELQNGSDIRGIAIAIENKKVNLTNERICKIGKGFISWLKKENPGKNKFKIAIGTDSRLSGEALKIALITSFIKRGCDVSNCNLSTTPAMFMTTILKEYNCDGAIMITASHLPYFYNGLKFFTKKGGLEKEDIRFILEEGNASKYNNEEEISPKGIIEESPLLDDYSKILVSKIRHDINSNKNYEKPFSGLKIVIDAGNGSGGFFAKKVLEELGADTTGSQFLDPDGTFPNHIPNPENKEAMDSIKKAVIKNKAHLGIIFDTDVDRAAIVDMDGREINRNLLIALISAIILEEHPGTTIVTDSVTSTGLKEFIEALGGKHHRFKRGYRNVINEAIRLNKEGIETHLAIETSGHGAVKENYFLDDGSYLIAKILIKMAKLSEEKKSLSDLIKNLKIPKESRECRYKIDEVDFRRYGEKLLEDLSNYVVSLHGFTLEKENYEGLRINADSENGDGWILVRMSLHEPLLVINVESNKENGCDRIFSTIMDFIKKYTSVLV